MSGAATSDPLYEACALVWSGLTPESRDSLLRRCGVRSTDPGAFATLLGKIGTGEFVRFASRITSEPVVLEEAPRPTGLVPTWNTFRGQPFADMIAILVEELGAERLRTALAVEGAWDLNWWLQYSATSHQVQDVLRRLRSSMDPHKHSEVWSRYLSELRRLGA